jgi:hypothetical protein
MAKKIENINLEKSIIVMDANVWLGLYYLPPLVIESVVNVLRNNKSTFWLPNQVKNEFLKNHSHVKDSVIKRYKDISSNSRKSLSDFKDGILRAFERLKNN